MKLFGVIFGVLYLYIDSVTVLAKIATTVTLMDKIKTTLVDKIKRNKSTKVEETNDWI